MPSELDNTRPQSDASAEYDPSMGATDPASPASAHGDADREGAMAKADLYKLANYSHKLYQQMTDNDQLESWVQAKITKAADYIASVYHYLEYEMKFTEYAHHLDNSDTLSEGQKMKIKELLSEAKDKMKDLKKSQAEKVKEKKMDEGILSGGEQPCGECGGSGMVHLPARTVPEATKEKVRSYNRQAKAMHAAHKRLDANHNGIPDDEEVQDEGFDAGEKVGSTKKTRTGVMTKTSTGVKHKNTSHSDEEHGEPVSKVKARSAADKAGEKAMDKAADKDYKAAKKANPEGVRRYSLGKQVDEAKKKGDGNLANNAKPYDKVTKGDVIAGRLGKDEKGGKAVKEAAPSAGLSKEKKSATVKAAKAGKDIGKPGKGFKKVADKAAEKYGSKEKGEKVAAAAMWKNIKETTAYIEEKKNLPGKQEKLDVAEPKGKLDSKDFAALRNKKETVKESTELSRMQEQMARLNRSEKPALVENREVDQIRALTKRLLG